MPNLAKQIYDFEGNAPIGEVQPITGSYDFEGDTPIGETPVVPKTPSKPKESLFNIKTEPLEGFDTGTEQYDFETMGIPSWPQLMTAEEEERMAIKHPNLMAARFALANLLPGGAQAASPLERERFQSLSEDEQSLEILGEVAGWTAGPVAIRGAGKLIGQALKKIPWFAKNWDRPLGKYLSDATWFRNLTNKERGVVIQTAEGMESSGMTEGQILREMRRQGKNYEFEQAMKERGAGSKAEPTEPIIPEAPVVPKEPPPKPKPVEPKTGLAKQFKDVVVEERKPSPLTALTKKEVELAKKGVYDFERTPDEIDFEKPLELEKKAEPTPAKAEKVEPRPDEEAEKAKEPWEMGKEEFADNQKKPAPLPTEKAEKIRELDLEDWGEKVGERYPTFGMTDSEVNQWVANIRKNAIKEHESAKRDAEENGSSANTIFMGIETTQTYGEALKEAKEKLEKSTEAGQKILERHKKDKELLFIEGKGWLNPDVVEKHERAVKSQYAKSPESIPKEVLAEYPELKPAEGEKKDKALSFEDWKGNQPAGDRNAWIKARLTSGGIPTKPTSTRGKIRYQNEARKAAEEFDKNLEKKYQNYVETTKPTPPGTTPEKGKALEPEPEVKAKPKAKVSPLKEQKEKLISDIDEAIKKAPTERQTVKKKSSYGDMEYEEAIPWEDLPEEQAFVKFQIGDTQYKIHNLKSDIESFKKLAKGLTVTIPKKVKPKPFKATGKPSVAKKERVETLLPIKGKKGWFTDGNLVVKGTPPKKAKVGMVGNRVDVEWSHVNEILNPKTMTEAKLEYYASVSKDIGEAVSKLPIVSVGFDDRFVPNVVFKAGKKHYAYQQDRFNVLRNRYPKAKYKIDTEDSLILVAYEKGKIVGGLMPHQWWTEPKLKEKQIPGIKMAAREGLIGKKQHQDTVELFSGIPFLKFSKEIIEPLQNLYIRHIGEPLWNFLSDTMPTSLGKRVELVDRINKGLIVDYRKDPKFIELRDETNLKIVQAKEKAKELAEAMAKFPRAEQIRIAQIIKGSVTATPERYKDAFTVAKEFQRLEKELQELGILGPDNRFRQLTRKEIASKFKEIEGIDKQIAKLQKRLKPVVKYGNVVRTVAEDISEEIISSSETSTEGSYETKISKWTELNEKRIKEALTSRGFAEGETQQMINRVKESVVAIEGNKGTLKEITKEVQRVVTKTVTQEIEKLKTYSPSMMARARGSIVKDINEQVKKRAEVLNRIRLHYKMSGKQYLRRAYESIENEKGFLWKLGQLPKKARLKKGYNVQRKDLDRHYREKVLGEIKKAPYLVFKGLSEEAHDAELMRLFVDISKNRNWAISPVEWANIQSIKSRQHLIPKYENFKPLPQTDKLGPLSGALVDPYIWDDLNQAVAIRSDLIKAYDKILTLWKTGKVVFNPATHCRNMLSNTILADWSDLPPHRVDIYARAAHDLLTKSGYWLEAKKTPLLGSEWATVEIQQFLKDTSEFKDGNFLVKASTSIRGLLDLPGKAYQGMEQFFKLAVFTKAREDGLSIKEAAQKAEKGIFNYQKIPPAIRWAKRWYSPFITFSYKAVPRFAETAVTRPWKIAKYAILFLAVEELTRRMNGESKDEIEREKRVLPDYMRNQALPGMLSHMRVPYKDEYDRSKYLDLSFILPWGDVAEQWGQSRLVGRPFLPSNPLWIGIGEIAFNEIMFTGQELTIDDLDGRSDYLKRIGTQIWRQAMPSLAGSYSFNKLMTAYKGEKDWAGRDRSVTEAIFDVFFGIKIRSIDYNEVHARKIRGLRGKINEAQQRFDKEYRKILFDPTPDADYDQKRYEKLFLKLSKDIEKITNKITEINE